MADGMNFNWFYCEGDLTPLVSGGQIPWEATDLAAPGSPGRWRTATTSPMGMG